MGWVVLLVILLIAVVVGVYLHGVSSERESDLPSRPYIPTSTETRDLLQKVADLNAKIVHAQSELESYSQAALSSLNMMYVKQLHAGSLRQANEWYVALQDSKSNKNGLGRNLSSLKEYRRSLAARRDASKGTKRQAIATELSSINPAIESLYEGIEKIGSHIQACRSNLDSYNRQTARIRDYLDGRYGDGWRNRPRQS